jgi:hypothetical protein
MLLSSLTVRKLLWCRGPINELTEVKKYSKQYEAFFATDSLGLEVDHDGCGTYSY